MARIRRTSVAQPVRTRPTTLELTILQVLWDTGPSSVRDVQKILDRSRPTGYTTVLKMLQIMTQKGLVERDESVRPQIYRAKSSQEQTQRRLLRDLIHRVYGGSVKALVLQALGTSKTSPETLKEIETLLDDAEDRHRQGSGGQGGVG
jgi:predicted transcriptional regulator